MPESTLPLESAEDEAQNMRLAERMGWKIRDQGDAGLHLFTPEGKDLASVHGAEKSLLPRLVPYYLNDDNGFSSLIPNTDRRVGHIFSHARDSSLCGVEKRFPDMDYEILHHGREFASWLADNQAWMCLHCAQRHRKQVGDRQRNFRHG